MAPENASHVLTLNSGSSSVKFALYQMGRAENAHAAEAIQLFCYQAKKFLGALAAVLGGLDTLIFTAGIGENAPAIRQRICASLDFLGIRLDDERNAANAAIISTDSSPVTVRVMRTDEDRMIARHVHRLMAEHGETYVSV